MQETIRWETKHFDELTTKELYEIMKVRFEVFVMEQEVICENDFDDLDVVCHHIIGWEDGKVVAYARVLPAGVSYDVVGIGRVLVVESGRRRGLATTLMEKAVAYSSQCLQAEQIKLSAQEYVVSLYEKVGFVCISGVYDEAGIPHRKMLWTKK